MKFYSVSKRKCKRVAKFLIFYGHPVYANLTIFCYSFTLTAFLYQRCITYTCVLSPEELADIIIEEIVPVICAQPQGVPVNFICRKLGLLIYNRFASKYKGESGVAEKVCCLLLKVLNSIREAFPMFFFHLWIWCLFLKLWNNIFIHNMSEVLSF